MWWASRRCAAIGVVLRAGSLDVLWPAPVQQAGQGRGSHFGPAAQGAPSPGWHCQQWPLSWAELGPAGTTPQTLPGPPAAALRAAVVAAFAGLKAGLTIAAQEGRLPAAPSLVVLLAGPAVAVLTVPWSEAMLRPDSAQRHARAELLARGCAVQAEDSVHIDARPALGRPRAVFWVPAWLQREVQALAAALKLRSGTVQALNLVAAAWLVQQPHDGRVWGLLGSGGLQLWSGVDASAAGEVLADSPGAAALQPRVQALWQRAGLRTPMLAASRLRVLSLDEAPPSASSAVGAELSSASSPLAPVDWLPWPAQPGLAGRAALNLQLVRAAQARPVLPLRLVPTSSSAGFGTEARPVLWAATLVALAAALALVWTALQHNAAVENAQAAPQEVAAPRAVATTAAERAELRAVNAAVQQLNLPLPQLLRTLQPPRDIAVRLHALELNPRGVDAASRSLEPSAKALVKLSAEAPRSRDMTRYVDFLAGRPGMGAVQLVRHEVDSAAGDIYRFELEFEWPR